MQAARKAKKQQTRTPSQEKATKAGLRESGIHRRSTILPPPPTDAEERSEQDQAVADELAQWGIDIHRRITIRP